MAGFEDIAKKAFYMGVGFAGYAQEKAGDNLKELKIQAQKLADEMIERGEMNTKEARKFVEELVEQAQQGAVPGTNKSESREPRRIEIIDEQEKPKQQETKEPNGGVDDLLQQVQFLQEELRRLKKERL